MKRNIFILILVIITIILGFKIWEHQNNLNSEKNISNTSLNLKDTPSIDLSDDPIFTDGSVPSTWDVAGITDPNGFKKFLIELQTSVLNNNRNKVISSLDANKFAKYNTLNNYDKLFNKKVIDAFKNINIHQIFRNYQGAMIGNGTVWFKQNNNGTFSIFAINNTN